MRERFSLGRVKGHTGKYRVHREDPGNEARVIVVCVYMFTPCVCVCVCVCGQMSELGIAFVGLELQSHVLEPSLDEPPSTAAQVCGVGSLCVCVYIVYQLVPCVCVCGAGSFVDHTHRY